MCTIRRAPNQWGLQNKENKMCTIRRAPNQWGFRYDYDTRNKQH